MKRALASALQNDATAAEQALSTAVQSPPGTAGAHMETAVLLMQLVTLASQHGSPTSRSPLVESARTHLNQARDIGATNEEKAHAAALTGLLLERYKGDLPGAAAAYRQAVQLNSRHVDAKYAAERIERSEERLRQRLAGKGGKS